MWAVERTHRASLLTLVNGSTDCTESQLLMETGVKGGGHQGTGAGFQPRLSWKTRVATCGRKQGAANTFLFQKIREVKKPLTRWGNTCCPVWPREGQGAAQGQKGVGLVGLAAQLELVDGHVLCRQGPRGREIVADEVQKQW